MGKGQKKSKKKKAEPNVTSAVIIDEKGVNLGLMSVAEARILAAGQGLDLVLVSEMFFKL